MIARHGRSVLPCLALGLATLVVPAGAPCRADADDPVVPPPPPFHARAGAMFQTGFREGGLEGWSPDREGVWSVEHGALVARLPERRQEHSFIYAGSATWTSYAVDLDVCQVRGVDKGVVVRVDGTRGIGVDLRGPGYHDVLLNRGEWPMARAPFPNANGTWHHLRVEALGHRYRVFVDGMLAIDKTDGRRSRPSGRIALAAYTGGVAECTVLYDNVIVTPLR